MIITVAMLTLSACGGSGGAGSSGDPRAAAIQTMLDKQMTSVTLTAGRKCDPLKENFAASTAELRQFKKAGATITPAGFDTEMFVGRERCSNITWPASYGPVAKALVQVVTGHQVVDKVGDEQESPGGGKMTPFRAHFAATPAGNRLIAAGLSPRPTDMVDGLTPMHKDADGNWVAQ